jgi:hypothetical protein
MSPVVHCFWPDDGVYVRVDHTRDPIAFVTTRTHRYSCSGQVDIDIPKNFPFDFASIPRVFWWLLPKEGRYARAALVHDYLYRTKTLSRPTADALFLSIMDNDGVSGFIARLMYAAVRLFGWLHYNRDHRNEIREIVESSKHPTRK